MKNENSWSDDRLKKVVEGLKLVSSQLLEEKRLKGQKLVVMMDGKIQQMTADEYLAATRNR
ncbi:MAG: hypothetical protein GC178_07415 [Flavobacteriales bacterium]|nr:hypothetical protein [Flavobacteriales bacterium]